MGPGAPPSLPSSPALPGWLAPVVTLTTQVGVPTVFAGILLYFVLFRLDTALKIIEQSEEDRVKIVAAMQESLIAALDRQTKAFGDSIQDNIHANERIAHDAARDREEFLKRFPAH